MQQAVHLQLQSFGGKIMKRLLIDTKPGNSQLEDIRPDSSILSDTKPSNSKINDPMQLYSRTITVGMYLGIPIITYPTAQTFNSPKT